MPDESDGIIDETQEILADEDPMRAFRAGVEDIKAGRLHDWDEVKAELDAGRQEY
jgi:predicted transcriptional regulator